MADAPPQPPPQGQRTEWITREYDADGALVTETVTVTTTATPKADAQPAPGGYL